MASQSILPFPTSRHLNTDPSYCDETELDRAVQQLKNDPNQQAFASAYACLLLKTAHDFLNQIQQLPEMADHCRTFSKPVFLFEAASFFGCMTGYAIQQANAREFEEDKAAIQGAVLSGLNKMAAVLRDQHVALGRENYLLSRFFLYPRDETPAIDIFLRLLHASATRDFPLLAHELQETAWRTPAAQTDYTHFVKPLCIDMQAQLIAAALPLVAHYRDHRAS